MRLILLTFCAFLAHPLAAQVAMPCDWQARADAIVEPWAENTKTFANGAVRVALLDVAEPAAAAYYLLILHPPIDSLGLRNCTVIGQSNGLGYAFIEFNSLEAEYDPAAGLKFTVPATIYLPEQSFQNATLLTIGVNQSNGDVTVTQDLSDG